MKKTILLSIMLFTTTLLADISNYKLAEKCKEKGDYKCALRYSIKQLDVDLNSYGRESKVIAMDYNELGYYSYMLGEYDEALDYYTKALKIDEKVLGKNHPYTATTYNNIAVLYKIQNH
jgi:tetratricopeptide (TPR) repeat protein